MKDEKFEKWFNFFCEQYGMKSIDNPITGCLTRQAWNAAWEACEKFYEEKLKGIESRKCEN